MRVFISSTSEDLKEYRQAAAGVVRDAQCEAVVMEHGPADPRPIVEVCRDWVRGCDLVLLIVAFRRGWVPGVTKGGDATSSITALEIAEADRLGRPVLAFFADDNWPGKLWDKDADARSWIEGFRANLNRPAKFFAWEADSKLPQFKALVSQELATYRTKRATRPASNGASHSTPSLDVTVALRRTDLPELPAEPYPLLAPYEHPATFGGRDEDIEQLASLVARPPLVLCVHAASGAGKSSLLLAGLAPFLRARGYTVAVERTPADPQLAQRLLRDVLAPPSAIELGDADDDLVEAFVAWVARAHELSRKPIVFVIDQVDDVLRNEQRRKEALARMGVLMAATAQRLPGVQGFACKWVLCYRHEFHGDVRAWLEDVLVHARTEDAERLQGLPYDLSDTQKSHDWVLPVVGRPAAGERGLDSSIRAFREAIEKPLRDENHYRYRCSSEDIDRLATVFARARRSRPDAPLVPELQVVLNALLERARAAGPLATPVEIGVPPVEELAPLIDRALADHLVRALDSAFPSARERADGRTARTRALIALEHLADAEGRRGANATAEELARMIGNDGDAVLARLAAPSVRLVVPAKDGTYALSHDQLAKVVVDLVRSEAGRGNLVVDQRLLDMRRIVAQKLALHQSDRMDLSALSLSRDQRALIEANVGALLVSPEQQAWWQGCKDHRSRSTRQLAWWSAASVLVMVLLVVVGYRAYASSRILELQSSLSQLLPIPEPDFARFAEIVNSSGFDASRIDLDDALIREVDPNLFAAGPWLTKSVSDGQKLDAIERSYPLFIRSRALFGAMSFALEEVFLRSEDTAIKQRARTLAGTVRAAFVAHHKAAERPIADPPPTAENDPLNEMRRIPAGRFQMGSDAADADDDEKPVHTVSMAEFHMQQHEVTNQEYERFDPTHEFPDGRGRHPVANVSWFEANAYAAWLGASLPTEAQWEFAARGSAGRRYPWGEAIPDATRAVLRRTEPVGDSRQAGRTPEGLDDMAGNVWEWCRDWYARYPEGGEARTQPLGPTASPVDLRVLRGGSFFNLEANLRAANRDRFTPDDRNDLFGFRLVSSRLRP